MSRALLLHAMTCCIIIIPVRVRHEIAAAAAASRKNSVELPATSGVPDISWKKMGLESS